MDITNLVAIDVHTHAHVSHSVSEPPGSKEVREAANRYFKHEGGSPTLPEMAAYYRERKMACVVFPVDAESTTGCAVSNFILQSNNSIPMIQRRTYSTR
jgi:uncharacterized protein